jgi:hypothetical protein
MLSFGFSETCLVSYVFSLSAEFLHLLHMDPVFALLAGFLVFAPTPELRLAAFHDLEMYFLLCMRAGAPPRQDPPRLSIRRALGGPLCVDQLPHHVFPRLFRFTREEFPLLVQAYNIPGVSFGNLACMLGAG